MKHLILLTLIAFSSIGCKTMTINSKFGYTKVQKRGANRAAKYFVSMNKRTRALSCERFKAPGYQRVTRPTYYTKCVKQLYQIRKQREFKRQVQIRKGLRRYNRNRR